MIATLCRYGHQRYADVLAMPYWEACRLSMEIASIVEDENASGATPLTE